MYPSHEPTVLVIVLLSAPSTAPSSAHLRDAAIFKGPLGSPATPVGRGAEARWRQSHDVSGPECVDQRLPDDIGLGVAVYQHDRHDVAVPTVGVAPWLFRCRRSQATACWSTVAACGVCGAGVTPGSSVSACAMSGTTTRSTRAGSS